MSSYQPIMISEIMAFCAMAGISDVTERMAILHAVQAMDAEFMRWAGAEREKDAG